jgi:hypothetical protein
MIKNILNIHLKSPKHQLTFSLIKNFGMYRGNRGLTKEYERERGEYNRAKKEMLKQHTKDFWEEQTRVENEWLEDYIKTQKEKKIRDDAKLRNSIITNSYICYENIVIFQ